MLYKKKAYENTRTNIYHKYVKTSKNKIFTKITH